VVAEESQERCNYQQHEDETRDPRSSQPLTKDPESNGGADSEQDENDQRARDLERAG
jgi:hypothetical protein